jgi:hypothetical protein
VGHSAVFRADTKQESFLAGGKYYLWRTELNTFTRKVFAYLVTCFRTQFSIKFGSGTLLDFSLLMACRPFKGLVIAFTLWQAYLYVGQSLL